MKNLFKNLMLVAVAAMAFTACSKDNNDVNAVSKITRYEFTANIADDTRSGFAEKEDGATAYKSEWFGNETVKLFVTDYQGYYVETTAPINAKGQFTLELENAPESFFMTVVSPAESWVSENSVTIPTEQTPLANSVDPKAHVLSAKAIPVSNGTASITMSTQDACYGKMTVNASDFEISKVEVSFNGGQVYTLNATNVENNVFWFAVDSMIDVSTFTVIAYDADDNAITKTVDVAAAGKELKFKWGHVSTFSVSGLEEYVAPEETYDYTSARVSWEWGTTDKLISFTSAAGEEDFHVNFVGRSFSDNSIAAGDYSIGDGIYSYGIYLGDYHGDGKCDSAYTGNLSVTIVDGCYVMVFTDLKDVYGVMLAERITFKGLIDGLELPDPRTKLAAPTNIQTSVAGKTITITWDAVKNADGYTVSLYSPFDEKFDEFVTDNQYVFTALNSNTKYWFKITATATNENPTYKTSDEEYFEATTEDTDPKIVLSKEAISFTADGGNDAVDVTLKNIDGDFTYTVDADWLTVTRSGASLAVSAPAYDNESEGRSATITITAGDLTKNIAVTQSKKAAEGGQTYSTVFTSCKCVNNMDMGEGWGAKFELSNDEGLFLWLWVIQTSVNQSTGAIATGVYNFHNQWCDYATQPGFVVKKMRLPGQGDQEFGIINATFESTLNGTVNDLTFVVTMEDNSTATYTFNGTVERAW